MNSSFPISQQINSKKVNDLSSPMAPPMSCTFSCQLSAGPTKTAASRAREAFEDLQFCRKLRQRAPWETGIQLWSDNLSLGMMRYDPIKWWLGYDPIFYVR